MIKKLSKLFIILILMVLPKGVFAIEYEHNHILSIEKFDIEGSKIKLEGYSYVSHIDNWGGKNLSTYIVAYTDDYSKNFENPNWETICNDNSSKCYAKKANYAVRNMWYARCTDDGCKKVASGISAYEDTKNRRNNVSKFTNNCAGEAVNQCLYENVGFTVTVDLADIASKFSGGNDSFGDNINFSIISVAETKEETCYVNSPLRVYTPICKVNGDTIIGSSVNSGDYTFILNGLSDTVEFDAVMAKVRNNVGDSIAGVYFQEGLEYKVLNYSGTVKTLDKIVNETTAGTFDDILLQLDSVKTDEDYVHEIHGTLGKKVVNNNNGNNNRFWLTDNGHDYYAIATHVVLNGNIVISGFKPTVKDINCSHMGWSTTSPAIQNSTCGKDGSLGTDASYNQCKRYADVDTKNVDGDKGYIYVQSSNSDCSSYKKDGIYDKVAVTTDILINQKVDFKYGNVNPGTVYAGKGFTFSGTELSKDITWMNAQIAGAGKPYYKYSAIVFNGASCESGNYNMNDVSTYHYYDVNGEWQTTTDLNVATVAVLENLVNSKYIKSDVVDNIGFKSCNSNDASSCSIDNPDEEVSGNWGVIEEPVADFKLGSRTIDGVSTNSYANTTVGKNIKGTYNYSLADSAVVVSGDEATKAKYATKAKEAINANKAINTGKKYFIDFRWIYSADWPFNLYDIGDGNNQINPSFVNEMDWTLTGDCSINVEDGYYTYDEGDGGSPPDKPGGGPPSGLTLNYRYRSISVDNPFPKGNIPTNWSDWFSDNTNKNRILGTYDKGVIYQYNLYKESLAGGTSNDYSSMEGINKNGSSDFVDFGTSASNDSYCPIGYFSNDCDE